MNIVKWWSLEREQWVSKYQAKIFHEGGSVMSQKDTNIEPKAAKVSILGLQLHQLCGLTP